MPLGLIHIERVIAGGHHHRKIIFLRKALDACAGNPIDAAAEHTMQQIQRRVRFFRPLRLPRKGHFIRR